MDGGIGRAMDGMITIPVELTVFGGTLKAGIPVPAQPVSTREMVPVFRAVAEAVIHLSVRAAQEQGRSVSCCAGCGACCRQLVPVSQTEARMLLDLIEAMPEPRRTTIRARFEEATRALVNAGLRDALLAPQLQPAERMRGVGVEYFHLGIPCPFLEDESCSIHPERPIICREYLVSSPAENCSTLKDVDGIKLPQRASLALSKMTSSPGDTFTKTVPLPLIHEWAKTAPIEQEKKTGPEQINEFLTNLNRTRAG
jgi:Fe-S-cluster containining protein